MRARGLIPPGDLATGGMATGHDRAKRIIRLCDRIGIAAGPRRACDIDVTLPDGRNLTGTVADTVASRLLSIGYSKVSPKRRLATWAQWLALIAAEPDRGWQAATVGRELWRGRKAQATTLEPDRLPSGDAAKVAEDLLQRLVDLYDRGMREPPPLACLTSAAYAQAANRGGDAAAAARREWESSHPRDGEGTEPEHRLVWGAKSFDELLSPRAREDEYAPGWDLDEPRRFGRWARRLWDDLLRHER